MDVRASRLIEDLTDVFRGELAIDPLTRARYATDASLYEIEPLAVACPTDADDVVTLVRYAAEHKLPLVPRGSGSTVAGGSLGTGIVIDFSRHLQRIIVTDEDSIRVEAGATLATINRSLAASGRYVAPDPANYATATVGGMVGVDAAGSRAVSVGSMYDAVLSLEVVTADGAKWEAAADTEIEPADKDEPAVGPQRIGPALRELLTHNAATIRHANKSGLTRPGGGYRLEGVSTATGLNWPRLFVGSEGTLALVTAATLRTLPLPDERGALIAVFDTLEAALQAVPRINAERPHACDLLDRRLLNLARDVSADLSQLLPATSAAVVIVEWTALSHRELLHDLERYRKLFREFGPGCEIRREAVVAGDVDRLWALPRQVVPLLQRLPGRERPLPFVEDILVPPANLEEFVHRAQRILQQHGVTSSLYAHALPGQIHLRPFLAPPAPQNGHILRDLAEDLYAAAWELGGAIASEHGAGLSRSGWLRQQAGPLYPVYRAIKTLLDPEHLLNPGKIVTESAEVLPRAFRPVAAASGSLLDVQLRWSLPQLQSTATACNGCGQCRTTEPSLRMCPMFRETGDEAASPRAHANRIRQALSGTLPVHDLGTTEFHRLAELCFNCKQCHRECPSQIDIPHLVIEAKAQYIAQFGVQKPQAWLARLLDMAGLWNRLSPVINPLLSQPAFRWGIERLTGLARERRLPTFARQSFLQSLRPPYTVRPTVLDDRTVVYFVDYFANHHDPELGWAAVRVLEKQGLRVYVPPTQRRCGMELITAGNLDAARALAEYNLRQLSELARDGAMIVCSEPTATVCLTQEYPLLVGTDEARLVADRTMEIGAFLAGLESRGEFATDFSAIPLTASYHEPCHLRALGRSRTLHDLCGLIPDFHAPRIEAGCSGMAGAFGLEARNFAESLQIGSELLQTLAQDRGRIGLTECSSCRMQMEQPGQASTLHPLKVLAMAYGLLPELRRRLLPVAPKP